MSLQEQFQSKKLKNGLIGICEIIDEFKMRLKKHPWRIGLGFGITSGIITTLGLIVGLNAGTNSKMAVIGGVLIIAIADAFSDALGIHVSEESENNHTSQEVWASTFSTFLSKLIFALTFIIPLLLFEVHIAIIISVLWGFLLLGIFSFYIAKERKVNPWKIVSEHLIIALLVIMISNYVGGWISAVFV